MDTKYIPIIIFGSVIGLITLYFIYKTVTEKDESEETQDSENAEENVEQ